MMDCLTFWRTLEVVVFVMCGIFIVYNQLYVQKIRKTVIARQWRIDEMQKELNAIRKEYEAAYPQVKS